MAKRRKKKVERIVHLSVGALPERLALRFPGAALAFTDASRLRHGGLAVVLYRTTEAEPEAFTRSVAPIGSNELELQAAIFGLEHASRLFAGQRFVLLSDNQDAINRLELCRQQGVVQDPQLTTLFPEHDLDALLQNAMPIWIPGHGRCRGNALADQHARVAAGGEAPPDKPASP